MSYETIIGIIIYKYKKRQRKYMKIKNIDGITQLEEILKKLDLPKKYYSADFDISEKYKQEIEKFEKYLLKINNGNDEKSKVVYKKIQEILPLIKKNKQRILDVFDYYGKSNPKCAQEEFDFMMDSIKEYLFIATADDWVTIKTENGEYKRRFRITPGSQFFRVRQVAEKIESIKNNADELFHIPLTKKAYTNSERFSLAGFPSLYLSTALPLAWQECGYPQKYYYSEYKYEKMWDKERNYEEELKFLALYSPREICWWGIGSERSNLWLNVVIRCLVLYPLVLGCSFVNHGGKVSYKQEYIVPQMLMQWVQRNNLIVQGISYFTCLDIEMMPKEYCAYNLAIPIMGPYDEKQYSKKLREEFTWSMPKYYEIPLLNVNKNKKDRKILYYYIEEIHEMYRKYSVPVQFKNYINEIERICVCLYQIMKDGNGSSMQMIIHILNLIDASCYQLKNQSFDSIIENVEKNENSSKLEKNLKELIKESKRCVEKFWKEDKKTKSIYEIIEKYRLSTWNDFVGTTSVEVLYRENEDIEKMILWMREHHLLYFTKILNEHDAKQKIHKKMNDIITPVIYKYNNSSQYTENTNLGDYIIEGFDFENQGDELLKKIYI